jgi:hypothetical protein
MAQLLNATKSSMLGFGGAAFGFVVSLRGTKSILPNSAKKWKEWSN